MPLNRIIDHLVSQPWALWQDVLDTYCALIEAKLARGDLALLDKPGVKQDDESAYSLEGGVAVVPVTGTLVNRNTFLSCFQTFGQVRAAVAEALADPQARAILLDIDSPGGTLDGTQETAAFLREAAAQKPLYAYSGGKMCSAAYWLGSVAQRVGAGETAQVGSIGILSVHIDRSGADAAAGIKRTYLTAGKYKALANEAEPLSDEARAYRQEDLDQAYAIFLREVAANRGRSLGEAQAMADGRVFLGAAARERGLIDLVGTRAQFLRQIKERAMDIKTLRAEHPDLVTAIETDARAGLVSKDEAAAQAKAHGQAETDRVLKLATAVLGQEAGERLSALAASGATPEQVTAVAAALGAGQATASASDQADRQERAAILQGLEQGSPQPLGTGAVTPPAENAAAFEGLVQARMESHKESRAQALKVAAKANPAAHQAWVDARNKK